MQVIGHHTETQAIDPKRFRQFLELVLNPLASMFEGLPSQLVDTTNPASANGALDTVKDTDLKWVISISP